MVNFFKTHLSTSSLTTYTHRHFRHFTAFSPWCITKVIFIWKLIQQCMMYLILKCFWLLFTQAICTGQWPKLIQFGEFGLPWELTLSHAFCLYALATVLIFICSFLVVFTGLVALLTVFTTILTVFPPSFLAENFELMQWNSEQAWFRIYLMILPVTHCIVACLIEVSMNRL